MICTRLEKNKKNKKTKDDAMALNKRIIDEEIAINEKLFKKYFRIQLQAGNNSNKLKMK